MIPPSRFLRASLIPLCHSSEVTRRGLLEGMRIQCRRGSGGRAIGQSANRAVTKRRAGMLSAKQDAASRASASAKGYARVSGISSLISVLSFELFT